MPCLASSRGKAGAVRWLRADSGGRSGAGGSSAGRRGAPRAVSGSAGMRLERSVPQGPASAGRCVDCWGAPACRRRGITGHAERGGNVWHQGLRHTSHPQRASSRSGAHLAIAPLKVEAGHQGRPLLLGRHLSMYGKGFLPALRIADQKAAQFGARLAQQPQAKQDGAPTTLAAARSSDCQRLDFIPTLQHGPHDDHVGDPRTPCPSGPSSPACLLAGRARSPALLVGVQGRIGLRGLAQPQRGGRLQGAGCARGHVVRGVPQGASPLGAIVGVSDDQSPVPPTPACPACAACGHKLLCSSSPASLVGGGTLPCFGCRPRMTCWRATTATGRSACRQAAGRGWGCTVGVSGGRGNCPQARTPAAPQSAS